MFQSISCFINTELWLYVLRTKCIKRIHVRKVSVYRRSIRHFAFEATAYFTAVTPTSHSTTSSKKLYMTNTDLIVIKVKTLILKNFRCDKHLTNNKAILFYCILRLLSIVTLVLHCICIRIKWI